MKFILDIRRCPSPADRAFVQSIPFETEDPNTSVAAALVRINGDPACRDLQGKPVGQIRWDCSCLQKKCGACAMRINGRPGLACDARLGEQAVRGRILLEPLRKFPLVADLIVDRQIMMDNLNALGAWLEQEARLPERQADLAYDASRCLQCGCCLEICPNFYIDGSFAGMAGAVPAARLLTETAGGGRTALAGAYRARVYEGCGKSLSCRNICPAGIDIDALLANSAAAAVWKRLFGRSG